MKKMGLVNSIMYNEIIYGIMLVIPLFNVGSMVKTGLFSLTMYNIIIYTITTLWVMFAPITTFQPTCLLHVYCMSLQHYEDQWLACSWRIDYCGSAVGYPKKGNIGHIAWIDFSMLYRPHSWIYWRHTVENMGSWNANWSSKHASIK